MIFDYAEIWGQLLKIKNNYILYEGHLWGNIKNSLLRNFSPYFFIMSVIYELH